MIETVKLARKPFYVDAVRVTEENMEQVAEWCQGTIREEATDQRGRTKKKHIHVRVHRAMNERQTEAYLGDWVLYAGTGYKVYTNKALGDNFDEVEESSIVGEPSVEPSAEPAPTS